MVSRIGSLLLAVSLLAVSLPLALERLGVLPRAYDFTDSAMIIHPVVREFPEIPVRLGILAASLAAVVASSLYVWKAHDSLTDLSDALERQAWRLRQLLPPEAAAMLQGTSRARNRSRFR